MGGGGGMMGWMNVWWIFGVVVVIGVLWLVFKSFGRQSHRAAPPDELPFDPYFDAASRSNADLMARSKSDLERSPTKVWRILPSRPIKNAVGRACTPP